MWCELTVESICDRLCINRSSVENVISAVGATIVRDRISGDFEITSYIGTMNAIVPSRELSSSPSVCSRSNSDFALARHCERTPSHGLCHGKYTETLYIRCVAITTKLVSRENRARVLQLAIETMAEGSDQVASALNRLTDHVFTEALSDRDQSSLSDLVSEFFCQAPNPADDPGM